jgi:hypothetical protein
MQLNAGDAGRQKHRKTSKKKSNRQLDGARRRRPPAGGAANALAPTFSGQATQAKTPKPALPGEASGIDSELQALKAKAQAYRKPHHREAAMLVLATVACLLIPASAGHLLLSFQTWAFLATIALLGTWLLLLSAGR